jgi:hypothetical protein
MVLRFINIIEHLRMYQLISVFINTEQKKMFPRSQQQKQITVKNIMYWKKNKQFLTSQKDISGSYYVYI